MSRQPTAEETTTLVVDLEYDNIVTETNNITSCNRSLFSRLRAVHARSTLSHRRQYVTVEWCCPLVNGTTVGF